jgi:uncharacterized protein (UPF0548 family)
MFRISRPTAAAIEQQIAAASRFPAIEARFLSLRGELKQPGVPPGFAHDSSRTEIGRGEAAFAEAARAFEQWAAFDLGWIRVANPSASIALGQVVAVEAHTLGLWTLNLSQIVEVERTETSLGFLYVTTELHVEEGEERFHLACDPASGAVQYEIEAVSRPGNSLARLGFPVTRFFQHRFARDSQRRMRAAASSARTSEAATGMTPTR